jgi:hypothetical protein
MQAEGFPSCDACRQPNVTQLIALPLLGIQGDALPVSLPSYEENCALWRWVGALAPWHAGTSLGEEEAAAGLSSKTGQHSHAHETPWHSLTSHPAWLLCTRPQQLRRETDLGGAIIFSMKTIKAGALPLYRQVPLLGPCACLVIPPALQSQDTPRHCMHTIPASQTHRLLLVGPQAHCSGHGRCVCRQAP